MSGGLTRHVPVLAEETLAWLRPAAGQTFVDGTLGGGGHARLLAEAVGASGRVIGLDRDSAALEIAKDRLSGLPIDLEHANYADLPELLAERGVATVDGIVLDLGLSSDQLANE